MGPDQTATAAGARPPAKPDHRVDDASIPSRRPSATALVIKDDARSVRQGLHPCR
jgi:hypothetical protein